MLYLQTLSFIHALIAPQLPDFCPGVVADATGTLAIGDHGDATETHGRGFARAPRTCRRFVTDFSINPDAIPDGNGLTTTFVVSGDVPRDAMPGTPATCAKATASITVYKKAAGQAAFTKVGTHTRKGVWTNATFCKLEADPTTVPTGTPNAAGIDVYRVAVHTALAGARATIAFTQPVPQ